MQYARILLQKWESNYVTFEIRNSEAKIYLKQTNTTGRRNRTHPGWTEQTWWVRAQRSTRRWQCPKQSWWPSSSRSADAGASTVAGSWARAAAGSRRSRRRAASSGPRGPGRPPPSSVWLARSGGRGSSRRGEEWGTGTGRESNRPDVSSDQSQTGRAVRVGTGRTRRGACFGRSVATVKRGDVGSQRRRWQTEQKTRGRPGARGPLTGRGMRDLYAANAWWFTQTFHSRKHAWSNDQKFWSQKLLLQW